MILHAGIQKILLIKLRAIGDVLLSTIVLKNLRHHFPHAQIDFLTEPPSREVLERNPSINNILIFDRKGESNVSFLSRLRKTKYDLVIDLFGNPRTALMTYATRAPHRVGFSFRGRRYAYNIQVRPRGAEVHNTEFNLDALRALGLEIVYREIPFVIPSDAEEYIQRFLRVNLLENHLLVGINPSGSWYTKRWGTEKFALLGDLIAATYKAAVIILWGPNERPVAERIKSMMEQRAVIPPPTNLKQLGALLRKCSLVVSNDAGPMHLSAVLGVPTLGIYGPTNPYNQGPVGEKSGWVRLEGLSCLGCNLTACPIGHLCMGQLNVEAVMAAISHLVNKNQIFARAVDYA